MRLVPTSINRLRTKLFCNGLITVIRITSGYATWFTAGGAIRIADYDVIDDVITLKL